MSDNQNLKSISCFALDSIELPTCSPNPQQILVVCLPKQFEINLLFSQAVPRTSQHQAATIQPKSPTEKEPHPTALSRSSGNRIALSNIWRVMNRTGSMAWLVSLEMAFLVLGFQSRKAMLTWKWWLFWMFLLQWYILCCLWISSIWQYNVI